MQISLISKSPFFFRLIRFIFGVVLYILLLPWVALAEESISAESFSFEQLTELANKQNPELQAARKRIEALTARIRSAEANFLPQFYLDTGVSRQKSDRAGLSFSSGHAEFENSTGEFTSSSSPRTIYSTSLSLEQNIFAGFRDTARVRQARFELEAAEAEFQILSSNLTYSLKEAFANALFSSELIRLSTEIASRRENNHALVNLRYEGGREHQGSLARSKAQVKSALYSVTQAKRQLETSLQTLATLAGEEQSKIALAPTKLASATPEILPSENSIQLLASQTPSVRLVSAQIGVKAASEKIAKSAFYPSVQAVGSLERTDDTFIPKDNGWVAGVSLRLPLFTGGRNTAELQAAVAEKHQAEATLSAERLSQARLLQKSLAAYKDAFEFQAVQLEFLLSAKLRATISRSQYTSGLLSFEDWDIIENDLIAAERAALQSQRDAVVAEAAWRLALGEGEFHP